MIATITELQSTTKIWLDGIQWTTFQALIAELESGSDFGFSYDQGHLQILSSQGNSARTPGSIVLKGISWPTYQALIADVGDSRVWRIAYSCSVLEIRMPLPPHEEPKILLGSFIEALADELEIEIRHLGALLLQREDLRQAVEPDTCFYIQNEARIRGKMQLDFQVDPPPDLAIESDFTNSSLNKFDIYANLGVPELWRYQEGKLVVYHLIEGRYEIRPTSLAFPFLPLDQIPSLVQQSAEVGQRATVRLFRQYLRQILNPPS